MVAPPRLAFALCASLAAAFLTAAPAPALVIDDFEAGDFLLTDDTSNALATTTEVSGLPGANVIGGVRFVSQRISTTEALPGTSIASLTTTPADDAALIGPLTGLDVTVDTHFTYDGIANDAADGTGGALGLNLSSFDFFEMTATAPAVTAEVRLTLYGPTQQFRAAALVDGVTSIALSSFTISLSDIRAIRVAIFGLNDGESVNLGGFEMVAIPEPGTAALLGVGLVGMAMRRRAR